MRPGPSPGTSPSTSIGGSPGCSFSRSTFGSPACEGNQPIVIRHAATWGEAGEIGFELPDDMRHPIPLAVVAASAAVLLFDDDAFRNAWSPKPVGRLGIMDLVSDEVEHRQTPATKMLPTGRSERGMPLRVAADLDDETSELWERLVRERSPEELDRLRSLRPLYQHGVTDLASLVMRGRLDLVGTIDRLRMVDQLRRWPYIVFEATDTSFP